MIRIVEKHPRELTTDDLVVFDRHVAVADGTSHFVGFVKPERDDKGRDESGMLAVQTYPMCTIELANGRRLWVNGSRRSVWTVENFSPQRGGEQGGLQS